MSGITPPGTPTTPAAPRRIYRCSFCDKPQDAVARLITGRRGVYICNECVALCNEILAEGGTPASADAPPAQR